MVLLKIRVNEIVYDKTHVGEKVWINNKEVKLKLKEGVCSVIRFNRMAYTHA